MKIFAKNVIKKDVLIAIIKVVIYVNQKYFAWIVIKILEFQTNIFAYSVLKKVNK